MKRNLTKKQAILLLLLFIIVVTFLSCATQINGTISADGSAAFNTRMSLEPGITALLHRLFIAGGQASRQTLDGPTIAQSMANAPGIASVTFSNTSPTAIEGQIQISQINDFLAATDGRRFISFTQSRTGGRFTFNVNRTDSPAILALLSPDITDYLNALMAPIATGEVMTKNEYLMEVASFYNRTIRDEIASSRIRAAIDFPGPVTNVRGGTFSGRRVNFDIPLIDFLVLETPLSYEVTWN